MCKPRLSKNNIIRFSLTQMTVVFICTQSGEDRSDHSSSITQIYCQSAVVGLCFPCVLLFSTVLKANTTFTFSTHVRVNPALGNGTNICSSNQEKCDFMKVEGCLCRMWHQWMSHGYSKTIFSVKAATYCDGGSIYLQACS